MSLCFLYNLVSESYSVRNSPWGEGVYSQLKVYIKLSERVKNKTLMFLPGFRTWVIVRLKNYKTIYAFVLQYEFAYGLTI